MEMQAEVCSVEFLFCFVSIWHVACLFASASAVAKPCELIDDRYLLHSENTVHWPPQYEHLTLQTLRPFTDHTGAHSGASSAQ